MRHVALVISPLAARQNVETFQPLDGGLFLSAEIQPGMMSVVHLKELCVKRYGANAASANAALQARQWTMRKTISFMQSRAM